MYKLSDVIKYDFFKNVDYNYLLDSLTGVISRGYIINYAKQLANNKKPFVMILVDIDNFKDINDNYGHKCGDVVLNEVGTSLIDYIKADGLVGRYGGDEFLIVLEGLYDYDRIHDWLQDLYNSKLIFRRNYEYRDSEFFLTATAGVANYPKDADNYDDLFLVMDKTLYRGKKKGRNCFIIYLEEKHKHINVHDEDALSLSKMFKKINNIVSLDTNEKQSVIIKKVLDYVAEVIGLNRVSFVFSNGDVISSGKSTKHIVDGSCINLLTGLCDSDGLFVPRSLEALKQDSDIAARFIDESGILTFILSKVADDKRFYGVLMFVETQITRIWQDRDISLILYLSKLFNIMLNN